MLALTLVELAAQSRCEAGGLIILAIHGGINHVVILDDESNLRISVTL